MEANKRVVELSSHEVKIYQPGFHLILLIIKFQSYTVIIVCLAEQLKAIGSEQ